MRSFSGSLTLALLGAMMALGCARPWGSARDDERLPGGATSTSLSPFPSSELPAANLPRDLRPAFYAGKALAHQPWVKAPSSTDARDGLGPLYNARTCLACHIKGGKGHIPSDGERPLLSSLLRLSIPGTDERLGAVAEPTYGLQLQSQSIALSHELRGRVAHLEPSVPPEAVVRVIWHEVTFSYPDGRAIALRKPELQLDHLGYGLLHPETRFSLRVAPPIHGSGLIELIDRKDLDALADPEDKNHDGVSGRPNIVWDFRKGTRALGRFGYKANRATLEATVAAAFAGDIGITTSLFPDQPCTAVQERCRTAPSGAPPGEVELNDELLALVVDFNRNLGVPRRRPRKNRAEQGGRQLFREIGCASCHHPEFRTTPSETHPHLGGQLIWPYSDFLLHDLGPDLSDDRSDYEASGREWRTAPLWGVGLTAVISGQESFLHDGRARSLEEAILWHGGEAEVARQRFVILSSERRQALLAFLSSL